MSLPTGPKTPAFLQTINWILRPLAALDDRARQFGDSFRALGDQRPALVYFSSPAAMQTIFTAPPTVLNTADRNTVLLPLLGEHSLILLDGDRHQRQRQLLMPPFHGDRMRAYGQQIDSITQQVMQRWQVGETFAVRPAMQEISLRVIASAVFGLQDDDRHAELRQRLSTLLDTFSSPLSSFLLFYPALQQDWGGWSPWGRYLRQKQAIDRLLYAEIAARRAESDPQRQDILALLLAARDADGQPLSDAELHDELLTLLFAGHETTASALAWALYWLHALPDVQTKLLAELATIAPDADATAVTRLPYLTAVCQETLRLYPIAINAFPRVVRQPIQIEGYDLEPGTTIIPSIYLAHHRPSVYPDSKRFNPDRFLTRQYSPYEYLPFGGGDRRCIGQAFALFEMKRVLATLMTRCQFVLASDRPIHPTRRGLTIAPSNRLRLTVTETRQPLPQPEFATRER